MYCLAIETSCDETAVAVLRAGKAGEIAVLSEEISSQADVHELYGGVVPELASREHLTNLPLITDQVLNSAKLKLADIDMIAVTRGPGLKGCLLMGINFAKGLARARSIQLIGVNHIEAHIFSAMLDNPELTFPFLALVVSGGHTEILQIDALSDYHLITRTLDDAAGEAFDKAANLLGIAYPGGAKLAALADQVTESRFSLPKVMREAEGFSFSGLKTAIALLIDKNRALIEQDHQVLCELCHAVQNSIVDAIVFKLQRAVSETGICNLSVSGGVSANKELKKCISRIRGLKAYYPSPLHCTDNAAMIGHLAMMKQRNGSLRFAGNLDQELLVKARWPVEEVQ